MLYTERSFRAGYGCDIILVALIVGPTITPEGGSHMVCRAYFITSDKK